MRFGLFLRVPWFIILPVLAAELALWIIILPFWVVWKLYDMRLARADNRVLGIVRPPRVHQGHLGAYRDWADRHMVP